VGQPSHKATAGRASGRVGESYLHINNIEGMHIKSASFVKSSQKLSQCPADNLPEYAFIGRSNVGKSSLINMLVGRKSLAKISSTPGKTRLINHFIINDAWFLADLPGYGYAKVSKKEREKFEAMIREYALKRENLVCFFVLIDGAIPTQQIDLEFVEWLGDNRIPFVIILTKTDKVNQSTRSKHLDQLQNNLSRNWTELPLILESSAVKRKGRDKILSFIEDTNSQL